MTPDRFARMAMQGLGYIAIGGDANRIDEVRRVAILLRRQHTAFVRLVNKQLRYFHDKDGILQADEEGAWIDINKLLAALAAYKKGTT